MGGMDYWTLELYGSIEPFCDGEVLTGQLGSVARHVRFHPRRKGKAVRSGES